MADLICTKCGEPWDMDYVIHEEPQEFERRGPAITSCPACEFHKRENGGSILRPGESEAMLALADVMGDDSDGYAAMLEDMGMS